MDKKQNCCKTVVFEATLPVDYTLEEEEEEEEEDFA